MVIHGSRAAFAAHVEPAAVPRRARLLYSFSSLGSEALSRSQGAWFIYYYAPPRNSGLPELLPGLTLGSSSSSCASLARSTT